MKKVVMLSAIEYCFIPGSISGEKEYLTRAIRAMENLKIDCIVTDPHGNVYDLKTNQKTGLTFEEFDVIAQFSNHITEMPFFDNYSIMALWNPVLYLNHMEKRSTELKRSKHNFDEYEGFDDFISPSETQWSVFSDYLGQNKIHFDNALTYMPGVSELNIIEPAHKFEKIFYVGIGWDKYMPGKPARHVYELTNLSKLSLLEVYGPQAIWLEQRHNVNYKGEIPQDGKAIFEKINSSGITLALASAEHIRADIVTNRVFEGIAAGSVVISNIYGKVHEMFGDNVLYVDWSLDKQQRLQQILQHYQWIQENPEQARQKVVNCQNILREKYSLEVMLKNILEQLPQRKQALQQKRELMQQDKTIDVVYAVADNKHDIQSDLQQILQQNYQNINIIVFSKKYADLIQKTFEQYKQGNQSLTIVDEINDCQEFASYYQHLKENSNNPYLIFFTTGTLWKHNHLSILMRLLNDNKQQKMAISKSSNHERKISYSYEYNDVLFNDYHELYNDVQKTYVNLSTILIDKEYFLKTINQNSFGSLDYLSGLYLLMHGIYDQITIVSQYMMVSNHKQKLIQYVDTLAWEKILMIKYLFPVPVHVVLSEETKIKSIIKTEQTKADKIRIEYVNYKKRWRNKNILGKITCYAKLRKLRKKYKKTRDI